MAKANKIKNLMTDKLMSTYGFTKVDARFIYEMLLDSFIEVWKENPKMWIPKLGTFTYKMYSGKINVQFSPADYCKIKIKGLSWEDFVDKKFKNKKDDL